MRFVCSTPSSQIFRSLSTCTVIWSVPATGAAKLFVTKMSRFVGYVMVPPVVMEQAVLTPRNGDTDPIVALTPAAGDGQPVGGTQSETPGAGVPENAHGPYVLYPPSPKFTSVSGRTTPVAVNVTDPVNTGVSTAPPAGSDPSKCAWIGWNGSTPVRGPLKSVPASPRPHAERLVVPGVADRTHGDEVTVPSLALFVPVPAESAAQAAAVAAKRTRVPSTGRPPRSFTMTLGLRATAVPTTALWPSPSTISSLAGSANWKSLMNLYLPPAPMSIMAACNGFG